MKKQVEIITSVRYLTKEEVEQMKKEEAERLALQEQQELENQETEVETEVHNEEE